MARKPLPVAPKTPLLPDWRAAVPNWRVDLMLARIGTDDYLSEVRAFENFHLSAGMLSDDWKSVWKSWCRDRLMAQGRVPVDDEPGLFGSL